MTRNNPDPPKFEFSNGWLDGFKKRYKVKFKKLEGKKLSTDKQAAEKWFYL